MIDLENGTHEIDTIRDRVVAVMRDGRARTTRDITLAMEHDIIAGSYRYVMLQKQVTKHVINLMRDGIVERCGVDQDRRYLWVMP